MEQENMLVVDIFNPSLACVAIASTVIIKAATIEHTRLLTPEQTASFVVLAKLYLDAYKKKKAEFKAVHERDFLNKYPMP